ncbi:MAG: helix-turn-helix domain-containing protein [Synergistaceae bacterium]|nr:helix-turn-helix domain-containing protein [Synergistaceae bacterium]
MSSEKTCTVAEAAKVLGLTEYTVRKKIRDGDIKAVKGTSDREGYRIPLDELMRYAESHGRSEIFTGFGLIADSLGAGLQKILDNLYSVDVKKKNPNYEKIKTLTIASIQDEIEATEYHIQALELDGDDISKEDRKKILEANAKIKMLERKIKEIELEYELNSN